jgi:hypothetical protein
MMSSMTMRRETKTRRMKMNRQSSENRTKMNRAALDSQGSSQGRR